MGRILIVDADASVRQSLRLLLESLGFEVRATTGPREALERVPKAPPDVVLLDAAVSGGPRVEFLRELHRWAPMAPVVLLTEDGGAEAAGHWSLPKPIDPGELQLALDALIVPHIGELVGASPTMREIERLVVRLARSPASTVLITGESGTGKNLLASVLHRASRRADAPFMNITCSALPETLLDSELFGHERGAFTDARERKLGLLERARGGTVFLDEIGEMSPALQGKMLRFIEEKTFRRVGGHEDIRADVRVVAATHRNLEDACRTGAFREDLFYRLAVLTVDVPPLRERIEDIEPLVRSFMNRFAEEFGKRVLDIEPSERSRGPATSGSSATSSSARCSSRTTPCCACETSRPGRQGQPPTSGSRTANAPRGAGRFPTRASIWKRSKRISSGRPSPARGATARRRAACSV